jgi:hypothetical protein
MLTFVLFNCAIGRHNEVKMIWISFAKWNSRAGSIFIMQRCYKNGHIWTPFVLITPRYIGHSSGLVKDVYADSYIRQR